MNLRASLSAFLTSTAMITAVAVPPASARDRAGLTVRFDHPVHAVSPTLYGLMTEEINHCYDRGVMYSSHLGNQVAATRLANTGPLPQPLAPHIEGATAVARRGTVVTHCAKSTYATSVVRQVNRLGPQVRHTLPPYSISVRVMLVH